MIKREAFKALYEVYNSDEIETMQEANKIDIEEWLVDRIAWFDGYYIGNYLGEEEEIIFPSIIDEQPVIAVRGFAGNKQLKKIVFPDNKEMLIILEGAFEGCDNLECVEFENPNNVWIENNAFKDCNKLYKDKYQVIGGILIDDIEKVEKRILNVPEGITEISENVYKDCSNLEEVILPCSICRIDVSAFENCTGLSRVVLNGDAYIYSNAFAECTNLFEVEMNGNLELDDAVFKNCKRLKSITGEGCIVKVYEYGDSFEGCDQLVDENGFMIAGSTLIRYTGSDENCIIPNTVTAIANNAFESHKPTSVVFSQKLKIIGESAFARCYGLKELNFPDSLETIKESAFESCLFVEKIHFGHNIRSIGARAFMGLDRLTEINMPLNAQIHETAFQECSKLTDDNGMLIINGTLIAFDYRKYTNVNGISNETFIIQLPKEIIKTDGIDLNYPGHTIDEFVVTNKIQYINPSDFMLYQIKKFKIIDSDNNSVVFETSFKARNKYDFLSLCEDFKEFCNSIADYTKK